MKLNERFQMTQEQLDKITAQVLTLPTKDVRKIISNLEFGLLAKATRQSVKK